MSLYSWAVRPALFALDAERAHDLTMAALHQPLAARAIRLLPAPPRDARLAQRLFGLSFDHPVGLGAGLDKQGVALPAWAALGLSFVEVGTVTPRPQPGNPRPRLFRLPADAAIINRFGFNSIGARGVAANLAAAVPLGARVGVNLGRNAATPNEQAADDYVRALEILHAYADYVVVNVSSPNTSALRALQEGRVLRALIERLVRHAGDLTTGPGVPVLVKVSPDLEEADLLASADAAVEAGAAGIIATNTTVARQGLLTPRERASETGGLSGAPLKAMATAACRRLYGHVGRRLPIIGVGGILTPDDAYERIRAGASLVQIYTALVYEGPGVISRIIRGLGERLTREGLRHVSEAIGADVR